MEQPTIEITSERYFDTERAGELRNLASLARVLVLPHAGSGQVLNHLLEKYPEYHPATTLSSSVRGYNGGLVCLALDLANCPQIVEQTGTDLQTAISYGVEIINSRLPESDNYTKQLLAKLALGVVTSPAGRLDFNPLKPVEAIDPFHHLDSM